MQSHCRNWEGVGYALDAFKYHVWGRHTSVSTHMSLDRTQSHGLSPNARMSEIKSACESLVSSCGLCPRGYCVVNSEVEITYVIIRWTLIVTFNRQLSGDWKNWCPGFGDLFRKTAMFHHPGNLISTYPTQCFYMRQMPTEKDDVLFFFSRKSASSRRGTHLSQSFLKLCLHL